MARRTLTIKRIDPWSVLKVGFLANLVLLGILLLAGRVVWFFIERLELIDRACEVASSVGFQDCGLNGGNIFRNAMLLGLLGVVVQTGILVFGAFLHNLIAELTGGLSMTVVDDGPEHHRAVTVPPATRSAGRSGSGPRPGRATAAPTTPAGVAAASPGAGSSGAPGPTGSGASGSTPRPTPGSGGTAAVQPPRPAPSSGEATSTSGDQTRATRSDRELFGGDEG